MGIKKDFLQSIKIMVHSAINNAAYDKIYNAQIIKSNTDATYNIRLNGEEYVNVKVYGVSNFNVGDIVKVVFPQNQSSQMFILSMNSTGGGGGGDIPTRVSQLINDSGYLTLNTLPIYDGTVV